MFVVSMPTRGTDWKISRARFQRDGLEALLSNNMRAAVTRSIVDDVLSWLAPERKAGTQMGDGEKEAAPLVHHNRDYDGLMPLRIIRVPQPVINKEDALRIALTTSALAKELSSLSAFPPVVAAASILLLIFQTIQVSIKT